MASSQSDPDEATWRANPKKPARISARLSGEPIMELVNGTFGAVESGYACAASSPCFHRSTATINVGVRNFKDL
jgi:hypothetical protein